MPLYHTYNRTSCFIGLSDSHTVSVCIDLTISFHLPGLAIYVAIAHWQFLPLMFFASLLLLIPTTKKNVQDSNQSLLTSISLHLSHFLSQPLSLSPMYQTLSVWTLSIDGSGWAFCLNFKPIRISVRWLVTKNVYNYASLKWCFWETHAWFISLATADGGRLSICTGHNRLQNECTLGGPQGPRSPAHTKRRALRLFI